MGWPPLADDKTIVAPSAVDQPAIRAASEEIAPTEAPLIVDQPSKDVSPVDDVLLIPDLNRIIESIAKEIPVPVKLANDSTASKIEIILNKTKQ